MGGGNEFRRSRVRVGDLEKRSEFKGGAEGFYGFGDGI